MKTKAHRREGIPVSERTAEDWGRIAVGLPGWRWMPGMLDTEGDRWGGLTLHNGSREVLRAVAAPQMYATEWMDRAPDIDDPATAGCLMHLLSPECHRVTTGVGSDEFWLWWDGSACHAIATLGRAIVAAAEARGGWL